MDAGSLMAVVLTGILYGFSLLMFMGTMWSLTYKQHVQNISRPIVIVAIMLFLLSTAHIVVCIIRADDALIKYRDTFPGGPGAFFADVTQETYVIKYALYVLQTLLADGVVIYRCYVVCQSVRAIILPTILWCSVVVTGVHAVYGVSQSKSTTSIFAQELGTWVMAFLASTIVTNAFSSGLLAYRIWTIERSVARTRASRKGSTMPIVRVLVDAAVLYSVALLTALICFLFSNNGDYVMVDMVMPIISIAFYMVLIRIAINRNHEYLSTIRMITATEQGYLEQHPMKPLQVHISQFTRSDSTSAYGIETEHQPSGRSPPWASSKERRTSGLSVS